MSRSALCAAAALALVGCKSDPEEEPVGARFDLLDSSGIEMTGDVGHRAAAQVRAVNEWGVPVASDDLTVRIDGVDTRVEFDGHGYGWAAPAAAGSVTVSVEGASPVDVHRTANAWPGFGLMPASPGLSGAVTAQPGTDGALVATASEVWWVDYAGWAHRVLAMPDGIVIDGMRSAHLDADGILDALVWGGDKLVLLRGRYGGGMSWGAGLSAQGMEPAGAAAGDLDGDGLPDVVVSWRGQTQSAVEVWHGDGLWGFTPAPAIRLTSMPTDVAVGDNSGEGREQITQVIEAGTWQRFVIAIEGRYAGTGPQLVLQFPEGTTVESGWDFNGDGGDEVWILGPRNPGQDREVIYYDLVGVNTTYLRLTPLAAHVAFADAEGDGLIDAWMLHETGELFELSWAGADQAQRRVATFAEHGPIAARDMTDDGIPEAMLAGAEFWRWYGGGTTIGENGEWWEIAAPTTLVEDLDLDPPLAPAEVDGSASTVEIVGFEKTGQNLFLTVWAITQGDEPTIAELDSFQLSSSGANPVDLAVCDRDFYALTDEGSHRIRMGTNGILWEPASISLVGDAVDCGVAPSTGAAVILENGTVHIVDADLVDLQTQTATGAVDVALVDFGSPNVVTCDTADCTVSGLTYGTNGDEVAVTGDASGLTIDDGTTTWSLPYGSGAVTTADVDGDGLEDLIAIDALGAVVVYRSSGEGFGLPESFHTDQAVVGNLAIVDVTGDGGADVLHVDDSADLVLTLTPGYVPGAR